MPEPPQVANSQVLSMEEIVRRHRGAWVLMQVTALDANHHPAAGLVLASSSRRDAITKALLRQPRTPRVHYYIFVANPRVRSGPFWEETRDAIDALAVQMNQTIRAWHGA